MLHLSRFIIPVLIILFIPSVAAEEVGVHYVIDLTENGSAVISEEHRISLASPDSESDLRNYSDNTEKIRADFRKEWEEIASIAGGYLGREISVQNFDLAVFKAGIGDCGLIKFSFECRGFADVKDGEILVGDIFLGGAHLHENDTLTIRYPEGYSVDSISPEPDASSTHDVVSFFGLAKKRSPSQPEGEVRTADGEDKIVQLLESAGGSMLQSEIVRLTGFSKQDHHSLLLPKLRTGYLASCCRI
jgi:hypothetical protein